MASENEGGADEAAASFWRTAKRAARHIPFMEDLAAAWFAARDAKTPLRAKAVMLGAVAYFVLPTDAIPDVLLAFGFTDDIAVLAAAMAAIRSHVTPEHQTAARKALAERC